jgi:DNA-binding transcriptional regulator LsrR (DeoR family)
MAKGSRTPADPAHVGLPAGEAGYADSQLLLAARLYYVDGILQSQIARMAGVSQAKVSRMLAVARERGLVQISVPEFDPRDATLEKQLRSRFKLANAIVVRQLPGQSVAELRSTLGYFAGPLVAAWLERQATVAIAGGRTLACLTDAMSRRPKASPIAVVQAMGNVDATPGPYDASEIGRNLAQRWGGAYLALNTPAFAPDAAVCRQLMALPDVRAVFDRLVSAQTALVGVGNLENSVFIERGILKPRHIQQLRDAGAVGEILGRFYDAAGRECATPFRESVVSLPLEKLRHVPMVAGVVAGSDRTAAIRGAIRGGILKTIVTDAGAAQALLEE